MSDTSPVPMMTEVLTELRRLNRNVERLLAWQVSETQVKPNTSGKYLLKRLDWLDEAIEDAGERDALDQVRAAS